VVGSLERHLDATVAEMAQEAEDRVAREPQTRRRGAAAEAAPLEGFLV
jgi:hypothetical protein